MTTKEKAKRVLCANPALLDSPYINSALSVLAIPGLAEYKPLDACLGDLPITTHTVLMSPAKQVLVHKHLVTVGDTPETSTFDTHYTIAVASYIYPSTSAALGVDIYDKISNGSLIMYTGREVTEALCAYASSRELLEELDIENDQEVVNSLEIVSTTKSSKSFDIVLLGSAEPSKVLPQHPKTQEIQWVPISKLMSQEWREKLEIPSLTLRDALAAHLLKRQ